MSNKKSPMTKCTLRDSNKHTEGRSTKTKTAVFGFVHRGGKLAARKVANADSKNILPIVAEDVKEGTQIYTFEDKVEVALSTMGYLSYINLKRCF